MKEKIFINRVITGISMITFLSGLFLFKAGDSMGVTIITFMAYFIAPVLVVVCVYGENKQLKARKSYERELTELYNECCSEIEHYVTIVKECNLEQAVIVSSALMEELKTRRRSKKRMLELYFEVNRCYKTTLVNQVKAEKVVDLQEYKSVKGL